MSRIRILFLLAAMMAVVGDMPEIRMGDSGRAVQKAHNKGLQHKARNDNKRFKSSQSRKPRR